MTAEHTTCAVVGGGPAGVMLGLLLARAGVDVTVLEKHADFLRDFRGDTVHPSTLTLLDELGLFAEFDELPQYRVPHFAVGTPEGPVPLLRLNGLSVPHPYIAMVPQWDFLNLLAGHAAGYPTFRLLTKATCTGVIEERGAIKGVRYRTEDGTEHELRAKLTVGADGRHSVVRSSAGLEVVATNPPMDVMWFRLPRTETDTEETFIQFAAGRMVVAICRGTYWQIAYLIPKGAAGDMKKGDVQVLRDGVTEVIPFLADRADQIATWDDVSILQVGVDHLRRWHRPGLLCIGDAAHTMSPVGGVGINLAVQDAVATANALAGNLLRAQRDGVPIDGRLVRSVQRRRALPAAATQLLQRFIQNRVVQPALQGASIPSLPRRVAGLPVLGRAIARFVAVGLRPEHVRVPERTPQAEPMAT